MPDTTQRMSATVSFPLSSTDFPGEIEEEDWEFDLTLTFTRRCWEERHPYGETVALERRCEDMDDFKLELNEVPHSEGQLAVMFGADWVRRTVSQLQKDAEPLEG